MALTHAKTALESIMDQIGVEDEDTPVEESADIYQLKVFA